MFLPYGTDAPIYHWPKATVGLIVVNVLTFSAMLSLPKGELTPYALSQGEGLHPIQWVTSLFLHGGFEHLIGNMIFLWAFGIVVEGKLGAVRFLALYLGIGVLESAVEQFCCLRAEPGLSFGASAAIYGLLAVCMVWAPRNELNCVWFWRFYPHQIDISILWFAIMYIGMECLFVGVTAGMRSSALYHSTGALIGFGAGVALLKLGLVDCENWDLFAVMQHRTGLTAGQAEARRVRSVPSPSVLSVKSKQTKKKLTPGPQEDPAEAATRRLRRHLESGDALAAQAAYDKAVRTVAGWQPTGPDWLELIKQLLAAKESRLAVGVMEDYLRRDPKPSPRVRLKLAQVLLKDLDRPAHALRVLEGFAGTTLPASLETFRRQLVSEAEALREEGVLELDGDAW